MICRNRAACELHRVLRLAGSLLVVAALSGAARAAGTRCAVDSECAAPQVCRQGVCRTSCSTDGNCNAGNHEACIVGQCMPSFSISFPIDYGLADGNKQPGCNDDRDCQPTITCTAAGVCQLPEGCLDEKEPHDEACPSFGGYKCNATSGMCEGPSCDPSRGSADCVAAYPVAGLRCVGGRCTSTCNSAADCCTGTGVRCPSARPQSQCYQGDPATPGVCVAEVANNGRLIVYQLANRDPRPPTRNLILVSEGFQATGADLDHFVNQALKHIQWQTTRADMLAALLSPSTFNIFILELPDRFTGLGQPTLFGHYFLKLDSTTWQYPGSDDHVRYLAQQALLSFSRQATPPLNPAPSSTDDYLRFHVILFNGGTDKRAHSNLGDMIFSLVGNDDGGGFGTDPINNRYCVLQHELGHSLGRVDDEYDNDKDTGTPPACSFNTVARTTVTNPPCSTCTTSAWDPSLSDWGQFVNTSTFPTTASNFTTVGLYSGAEERFPKESMRSQLGCMMRQSGTGRLDYCTACREALMANVVADAKSQSFRFLDMPNAMLVPDQAGIGPNLAVAVDTSAHHAYITREIANKGIVLSDIDGNILTREGVLDVSLNGVLGGAGIPATVTPFGRFVLLEGINPSDATQSKVVVYDSVARALAPVVAIPGLLGTPVAVTGASTSSGFAVYRRDPAAGTNQMAFVDIGTSSLSAPTFSVPTSRAGGMPRLEQPAVLAPTAGRVFFPATKVTPAETFCDFDQCQIWAFDPAARQFVDPIVSVSTPGVSEAGIVAMTVGQHVSGLAASVPGELLIVVTDNRVLVYQTAQLLAGNTVPATSFAHSLGGGGGSLVTGVGFVPQTEQIVLTNRAGVVAVFGIHGENGPGSDQIAIPGLAPGTQIRDLSVRPDGSAYLVAGGFSGARDGVIAALDLSGNQTGANRVVFVQPVSSIGLAQPSLAVDDTRGVVYSNAVIETGDATGVDDSHRYRSPLVRALHETRSPPAGCP